MEHKKNPLSVFFLYSSIDRIKVEEIYSKSIEIGIEPWIDIKQLLPSMNWEMEIQKALDNSQLIFIFLSSFSISREGFFHREIRYAIELSERRPEGEIFIIPIRLDNCQLPHSLSKYQFADFSESQEDGWKALIRSINVKQESLNFPLSPQPRFGNNSEPIREINTEKQDKGGTNKLPPNVARNAKTTNDIIANIFNITDNFLSRQPDDIEGIAASQIQLLTSYYSLALSQAQRSFTWALIWAFIGVLSFIGAGIFLLINHLNDIAYLSTVGGVLIEVISGINFYLYNKSSSQLAEFHTRLDSTQRTLLANTICEKIEGDLKQKTRSQLALAFAGIKPQPIMAEKEHAIPLIRISKMNFNPEGKDIENECVEISNFGNEIVDITEWKLLDKIGHEFIFPKISLYARQSLSVWTKAGKNTETDLFWNKNVPIWNNKQDCAYLKTNNGVLIDFYCYASK